VTHSQHTARASFDASGRLRALIADGEETNPLAFLDVTEGAEPLTREQITAALSELEPDELAAVIDAAVAEGQAIGASDDPITPEVLARINALADTREEAEARQTAIAEEAEHAQQARDEALARLVGTTPDGEGDGDGDDTGDGEGDGDGSGEGDAEGADAPAGRTPETVTAGGTRRTRPSTALPRPGQRTGTSATSRSGGSGRTETWTAPSAQVALVAAAGLESVGLNSGGEITTAVQLGEALNAKRHAIRRSAGGDGEQLTVASIRTTFPQDRYLSETDVDGNTRNLDAATSSEVLVASAQAAAARGNIVAAGGLCAPITQLYDVPVIGSAARPVRDALTNMGADRGGIKWRQHLSFGDFAGATGVWTIDNDEAVGTGTPPAPKPCLDVECPGDAEAYVEAITFCMTFSNVTSRFDAEATAANVQAAQIAHARYAENRLMSQIAALSTTLTAPQVISATRDILLALDRLFAAHRNFYRLEANQAFRIVLPQWILDALRADLLLGAGFATGDDLLDGYAVTDAQIMRWFQARNVNATFHLDGRAATTAGAGEVTMANQFYAAWTDNGAVPDFPAQLEALMWVEGEMIHLDGGTLDLGVVRDSTLNQNNRYKQFTETFEGVAHRGVESIRLVADLQISGMTAGTADTKAILTA
jgi:hypothetical protein